MKDEKELLADLVHRAELGEHTGFEYIRSWKDYKLCKMRCRALDMLIDGLNHSLKLLLKKYCKAVAHGTSDITQLLVRNVLLKTKEFYEIELSVHEDMLSEYNAFLYDGNFISQFIFYEIRPISECWDRRNLDNGF